MKYCILLLLACLPLLARAQQENTLRLTPSEVEVLFLKQNLELIAEKMNITIADAAIAQARLWDNPSLAVEGVNLWSTDKQRGGEAEVIPPLFGAFGRNTQFTVELSQLVQTARKRSKLIGMEKVSREIAVQQLEDILRGLKVELRKLVSEITYSEEYKQILLKQTASLAMLIDSYTKQAANGNFAKSELLRLHAAMLEADNELNDIQIELNSMHKTLKALLNVDPLTSVSIVQVAVDVPSPDSLSLAQLIDMAAEGRPDVHVQQLQVKYFEKSLAYERAQRVPDLTASVSYDRFGNVWKNFFGFGISFDIPVLNRNQGNIRAAKAAREQSEYLAQQQQSLAKHEVVEAYGSYLLSYSFYKKINANPLLQEMDGMLDAFAKNLLHKHISMVEYIDFMESYKNSKQAWIAAYKNLLVQLEELQYAIGTDIK